jgi:predicted negative regulator of RcsB-dependent stress response
VSRITRKELKTDKFALEVGHGLTFFEEHRSQIGKYAAIAVGVVVLILGYNIYSRKEHAAREQALAAAIRVQEAVVGISGNGGLAFPTQEAKDQEAIRVFSDLQSKYSGSAEGQVAQYYLASIKADQGKLAEAEKLYLDVSQKADEKYASLAKFALAQIYFSDGRADSGEKLLRELIANPTVFVSADQATLTLARAIGQKKPAEARKLLDPLRNQQGPVGQLALTTLSELPPQ